MLVRLIDRLLRITETYQLLEGAKDDAQKNFELYLKHIFWYLECKTPEERKNSLSGARTFLKQLENAINRIPGKFPNNYLEFADRMKVAMEDAEARFRWQYKKEITTPHAISVYNKAKFSDEFLPGNVGIVFEFLPKNKVKLILDPTLIG